MFNAGIFIRVSRRGLGPALGADHICMSTLSTDFLTSHLMRKEVLYACTPYEHRYFASTDSPIVDWI